MRQVSVWYNNSGSQVEGGFGGVYLYRYQQVIPKLVIGVPGSLHLLRILVLAYICHRGIPIIGLPRMK